MDFQSFFSFLYCNRDTVSHTEFVSSHSSNKILRCDASAVTFEQSINCDIAGHECVQYLFSIIDNKIKVNEFVLQMGKDDDSLEVIVRNCTPFALRNNYYNKEEIENIFGEFLPFGYEKEPDVEC
jgi:hypothetical protein